ncbi:MAG: helix-turn-helix transcriptional regulator, partial [Anaerolineae bacterium]|nr:helix-turn-helix transcriptional regulator [Anaerolineae bacterium]
PIAALRVRIWLEQGRMAEALAWVQEQGLSVDDDLSYLHEFEHLTLARVRLARYPSAPDVASLHETLDFLDRLLQAADAGNRLRSVIEILALQACAHEAQGNTPRALVALERALALAEPEGYVRIFVDAGRPLAALLSRVCAAEADRTPRMQAYCDTLAAAFDNLLSQTAAIQDPPASPATQAAGVPSLIEPLTPREREVLQLIAAGYSNPDIAAQLVIAVTTVKTHAKNIYGKLGVSNRFQAAARAKDLQLL